MIKKCIILTTVSLTIFFCGCQTITTQRVATDSVTDIGDKWNDTDSKLVADGMIQDVLEQRWLKEFKQKHNGKNPTVIIGTVKNRSYEHINVKTFIRDLEKALLNSGEIEFVASKSERDEIRNERLDQASNSSESTAKLDGEEVGADYMLKGELNSIVNKDGGESVKFYQVNLTLIDMEKNKKVWIGEKKIKKLLKQSRFGL